MYPTKTFFKTIMEYVCLFGDDFMNDVITLCPICQSPLFYDRHAKYVECENECVKFTSWEKLRIMPEERNQPMMMIAWILPLKRDKKIIQKKHLMILNS